MATKHDIDPSFLEQMRQAWERRQRVDAAPRSLFDVTKDMRKSMFGPAPDGVFKEGKMLKAKAKRFANSNQVIGNTVFSFDKDGLTQIIDTGYARYDYETLLKMSGVHAVEEAQKAPAPSPAPKHEDKAHKDEPKKAEVQNKSPEPVKDKHSGDSDSDKHSEKAKEAEKSEKQG